MHDKTVLAMDINEKALAEDKDGMASYECLVNNFNSDPELLQAAIDNMERVDATGQFTASAARFLAAISPNEYSREIDRLLKLAIDKDRAKAYLPDLLSSIWGADYELHAEELREKDDNFRRIYKRVYPASMI